MNNIGTIATILLGLSVCILLIIKLIQVIKGSDGKKKWSIILTLISKLCAEAEDMFDKGVLKKEYVLNMIKAFSDGLEFTLSERDISYISDMIDCLISMTKQINISNNLPSNEVEDTKN